MKAVPHTCIDHILHQQRLFEAMRSAVAENPSNNAAPRGSLEGDIVGRFLDNPRKLVPPEHAAILQRMALITGKMWSPGRTLTVSFLDGGSVQRRKVAAYARRWMQYANITLSFTGRKNGDLRISFGADPGSWSTIGTDALIVPVREPTMNFGWLTARTPDGEYERVVLHEFGHALGCIHEHQNPAGEIKWNKPEVYKYFQGPPNYWTKEDVDHNLFAKYSADLTQFSRLDPLSIMMYPIPKEFTLDGFSVGLNATLSATDTEFIREKYP